MQILQNYEITQATPASIVITFNAPLSGDLSRGPSNKINETVMYYNLDDALTVFFEGSPWLSLERFPSDLIKNADEIYLAGLNDQGDIVTYFQIQAMNLGW